MVVVGCPIAMTYDIATPIKMGMTMAMTWFDGLSYYIVPYDALEYFMAPPMPMRTQPHINDNGHTTPHQLYGTMRHMERTPYSPYSITY